MKKIQHLVIDSGALLRNAPIYEMAEKVYTVKEVVSEIRDRATLDRLQVLPYDLNLREPTVEEIRFVSDFSKKSGDYPVLSATDIKVLTLTLMLHKEFVGDKDLKTEPTLRQTVNVSMKKVVACPKNTAGFYMPEAESSQLIEELKISEDDAEKDGKSDCEDEDGWITPGNISNVKKGLGVIDQDVEVACMTTDFAMQNVLKQMGLQVVSVDGMLITQTRTFIFRCYSCFATTSNMTLSFCPKCGNRTLKRVSVTLNEDGSREIHISARRPLTGKGKRFSLPLPQGGMRAKNPVLVPDQKEAKVPVKKKWSGKIDAMQEDYMAGTSPFSTHDVYSKAAFLGAYGREKDYWNRRNPNEVKKRGGKRK